MRKEISCGAVVYTQTDDGVKFVIIQSLQGAYGFPKGHMEGGETERQTALREIREEVGLDVELLPDFRAEDAYPLPRRKDVIKRVIYFLATYSGQTIRPLPSELRGAALLDYDAAMAALTFEGTKRILRKAADCLRAQGII